MAKKIYPEQTKRQKLSNWIIIGAIIVMSLATWWIVERNYNSGSKSHEFIPGEQHAELQALQHSTSMPLEGDKVAVGDELIFSMSTTFPANIALIEIAEGKSPRLIFSDARIPPGKSRLIEIADEKFVYVVKDTYPRKICLLATQSESDLKIALSHVRTGDAEKLMSNCLNLNPQ